MMNKQEQLRLDLESEKKECEKKLKTEEAKSISI